MFMLYFADVSIFARPPFKTHRSHLKETQFFLSLAVFWLLFGTFKGPNGFLAFLVSRLRPKKTFKLIWEIPKSIEKCPLPISLA